MATLADRARSSAPGRFHTFLLAATVPLFLGVLLSDYAYWTTHEIEWSNFASWLLVGALVFGGGALLFAVIDLLRGMRAFVLLLLQLATWITGFVDALIHARDAWAVMPTGLVLSAIVAVLAAVTTWIAFSTLHRGDRP
jgi:uncharacterized membrane protein